MPKLNNALYANASTWGLLITVLLLGSSTLVASAAPKKPDAVKPALAQKKVAAETKANTQHDEGEVMMELLTPADDQISTTPMLVPPSHESYSGVSQDGGSTVEGVESVMPAVQQPFAQ
jgi:hypothetical protein